MSFLFHTTTAVDPVRVCRVCLVMEVKMYSLQSSLQSYYEAVSGIPVVSTTELPMFLCYECACYVNKFYNFKDKCHKGQATLYGILNSTGQITEHDIRNLDRNKLELTSNISVKQIEAESLPFDIDSLLEIPEIIKIKDEPILIDTENNLSITVGIDNLKEEHDFPDLGISSDDEPLSMHKTRGKKKVKKKKKKKDCVVDDNFQLDETFLNVGDVGEVVDVGPVVDVGDVADVSEVKEREEVSETIEPVKRKRGRPRKTDKVVKEPKIRRTTNTGGVYPDDINLEEYVDIISLSLEEQMEEINKRKESDNYLNALFQCNLCYKGFIDVKAWHHHVAKHEQKPGDIECPVCKFRFVNKRALHKHATNHEKKYACKACSYVSKTTTQAKQHQRWHKGVTYTCEYCDEVSTKWTSYLSHVRIKHPSSHVCGVCGYSFVSSLGLTMHKTMMHKDVKEPENYESGSYCEECDVKFISLEAYKRHMVTSVKHSQSKNFSRGCRVCGGTFPSAEELRLHHRSEHARQRPKHYGRKNSGLTWPINCQHCNEVIENARDYWTHFRRNHPDKPYPIQKNYVCDICGKSFRGNAFLTYHKRTHSGERAFACGACGKSFHNRSNLNLHVRTHSDLRPHPCAACPKAFKCKSALDRHYRTHTGIKPYECEVCGKAFGQSNSRKLHVRTVHLKQPAPFISRSRQERKKLQKEQTAMPFVY